MHCDSWSYKPQKGRKNGILKTGIRPPNTRIWPPNLLLVSHSCFDIFRPPGPRICRTVDRPQRINIVDLLPEYKAWASFIQTVIDQTSATTEMIRERVIILHSLISDEEIDVGKLMAHSVHKLARTDRNTLGHCCLINMLCQVAQVLVEPTDVTVRSLTFILDSLIEGYEKE